jgi:uncharacterized protein (UPF0333 family)
MPSSLKPFTQDTVRNQRGQIVVEYVLLMVVGVALAALITTMMVSRNPESPGFLVRKWFEIIRTIGADTADDLAPEDGA